MVENNKTGQFSDVEDEENEEAVVRVKEKPKLNEEKKPGQKQFASGVPKKNIQIEGNFFAKLMSTNFQLGKYTTSKTLLKDFIFCNNCKSLPIQIML
jgi:hypothetical protein